MNRRLTDEDKIHLEVPLGPACKAEIDIEGEITGESVDFLIKYLQLLKDAWEWEPVPFDLNDLKGIAPNATGDLSSEEYVARQRSGE